jgi:hypothetical protein
VRFAIAVAMTALGVAHAQTTKPFSHRLHLKLTLECTHCHIAAAQSSRVDDNLLPKKEVCLPCHKDVVIPPPPVTPLERFSHAQHMKLGNIAPVLARAIDSKTYLSPPSFAAHQN